MTTALRVLLIAASILVVIYAFRKIRKAQLNIDDALYWVVFAALLVVMSIFPSVPFFFSELIGFESPANFIFLLTIFLVIVKLFIVSIDLSVQKHRLNNLIQRLAIMNHEKEKNEKKAEEERKKDNQ